jgi:hypothetical protein
VIGFNGDVTADGLHAACRHRFTGASHAGQRLELFDDAVQLSGEILVAFGRLLQGKVHPLASAVAGLILTGCGLLEQPREGRVFA